MKTVLKLCRKIEEAGGRAYIVGGWVRDRIMSRESKDIDIEVFGIEPSTLESILPTLGRWRRVGTFEIYLLNNKYDIIFPRNDKGEVDINLSVEEAGKRRDLTINSIYYDLLEDRYIDCYGGIEDIEKGKLRYVDREEFDKDPLRILRVITFLARFKNFSIDRELKDYMRENVYKLGNIKKERILIEFDKILLKGIKLKKAFEEAEELGILQIISPELEGAEIDYSSVEREKTSIDIALAILYLKVSNYREALNKLLIDTKVRASAVNLIENYEKFKGEVEDPNRVNLKWLMIRSNIKKLAFMYRDMNIDREGAERVEALCRDMEDEIKPLMRGRDLIEMGYKPGEEFSRILEELFALQIEKGCTTKEELVEYGKSALIIDK